MVKLSIDCITKKKLSLEIDHPITLDITMDNLIHVSIMVDFFF